MLLTGCGAAVGVVASLLLPQYMASLLFGVSPQDWVTMTSVPVLLGW